MRVFKSAVLALTLSATVLPVAMAAEHEIEMLNQGSDGEMMVFEPAFLQIEPGDGVTFVPTDAFHNAATIEGMLPEGGRALYRRNRRAADHHLRCARRLRHTLRSALHDGHGGYDRGRRSGQPRGSPLCPEGAQERIDALFAQVEAQ